MRYLLFISQNYSFEILRPIQQQAIKNGDDVRWLVFGNNLNQQLFNESETVCSSVEDAVKFNPDACFVPGNKIPSFIPGIKVQVFHGFEWKKKGHFRIRECFDLYCTQGPFFTEKFAELADQFGYFDVVETGWPKLDKLFDTPALVRKNQQLPCILYAPTFSPSMTSGAALKQQIQTISATGQYHWLVKFHPKMDKTLIAEYKAIESEYLEVVEESSVNSLLQTADIMLSDTSSIITEFMLLNKPVITFNNVSPEPVLINISNPEQLSGAIDTAFSDDVSRKQLISDYASKMHPYNDGKSAVRILEATNAIIEHGKKAPKSLPSNLFRNLKMRKKLGYWKW